MKIYLKIILIFVAGFILFSSCEKEITLELPKEASKLVVEGWIEQDQPPIVILTKSSSYFDSITQAALFESIVSDAVVKVSDGITTEQLTYTLVPFFPLFAYQGSILTGEIGKIYTLSIEWQGQYYSAVTTIQNTAKWDSLWFELKPDSDSIGNIFASAQEDGSVYNYYRAYTKILNVDQEYVPILGSVWDDKFFNGQTFSAQLYHGFASNIIPPDPDESRGISYKLGDSVVTRLSTMDYESYEFWKAAESEIYSGGNPFASTTTVPTNISNGALGCWTGYGSTYDTIVCK